MTAPYLYIELAIAVPAALSIAAFISRSEKQSWLAALAASLASLFLTSFVELAGAEGSWRIGGFIRLGARVLGYTFVADPYSRLMAVTTATISFLVILFSRDYMSGDPGYRRYYAALLLFEAAMLGVAYAANLVTLLVFWEILGFTSFILIGYWYQKPRARRAARLALLVTGSADLGLIAAVVYGAAHSQAYALPLSTAPAIVLALVSVAALAKSAQFPLHIWLLEAMEAPTTVSALLHSATMVAAGAYLLERIHPALLAHRGLLLDVSALGCFTALYAAILALREIDAKRVLAYSTVSNLGVMIALLYAPTPAPSMVHLVVHAFFKATLFLAIAAAIHSIGSTSLAAMGGLRRRLPYSYAAAVAASLAQVGLPLYGVWDSHVAAEAAWGEWLRAALYAEALLAGLYIGRWLALAYHGEPRTREAARAEEHAFMRATYVLLIPLIAVSGAAALRLLGVSALRSALLCPGAALSSALGLAGLAVSVYAYSARTRTGVEVVAQPLALLDKGLYAAYYTAIPMGFLGLGRGAAFSEEALERLHEEPATYMALGLGSLDEPPRRRGAQYMLLLGFFAASAIIIVAYAVSAYVHP